MRCPKCQYISFDSGDRCRNCGYEFSLTVAEDAPLDVKIGRDDLSSGRIRDGSLGALDAPLSHTRSGSDGDRVPNSAAPDRGGRPLTMSDLPLFIEQRVADDQAPLVTPPAVPRPPLSVRRANPTSRGRGRSQEPEELSLDLGGERDGGRASGVAVDEELDDAVRGAGIVRRFIAGVIDVVILGSIDAAVVYLTLRLCELPMDQWRLLPVLPLGAFLLLLSGGYFVLFTAAGGQTIGKMSTRIRVVAASADDAGHLRVSFGTALVRALACLVSVLAVGAGFLPVLFRADRRAFHDRVAETRVVPA
jgi:uncharacterized RDD family membrane protein YckC